MSAKSQSNFQDLWIVIEVVSQFFKTHLSAGIKPSLLVAVSGGVDSIALADVLFELGFNIQIAHCNFQLRSQDSDNDEKLVREFSSKLNVIFHSKCFTIKSNKNVQLQARQFRYAWFEGLCSENDLGYVAVGSHLNDQAETILHNMLRGTAVSGLRGMRPIRGSIIRPFLDVSKDEIVSYATARNLQWREDKSNQETKYRRNKIRHEVIPKLLEIEPSFLSNLSKNTSIIRSQERLMNLHLAELKSKYSKPYREGVKINLRNLLKLDGEAGTALNHWLLPLGFSGTQVQNILHSHATNAGQVFHTASHSALIDRGYLKVEPLKKEQSNQQYYLISKGAQANLPIALKLEIEPISEEYITAPLSEAWLSMEKLKFPLRLRKWKAGDYFYPLGMQKKKKLSDFFIDQKIPLTEKADKWVLLSEEKICWVVGHRIDNRFKVTSNTTNAGHFSIG